jgi:hypothetical protein
MTKTKEEIEKEIARIDERLAMGLLAPSTMMDLKNKRSLLRYELKKSQRK